MLDPRRRAALAVAHVVVGDRRAAVARRRPRQADAAAARHAGRDRRRARGLVRLRGRGARVGAGAGRVRGPHLEGVGGAGGQPRHRGRRRRARVRVLDPRRRAALAVAHVVVGDRRAAVVRRWPAQADAAAARHAGRDRRRSRDLVRFRGRHAVRTGAVGVDCANAELVGGAGRQPRDRRGSSRAGVSGIGPGCRRRLAVADVVAGDGRAAAVGRRPSQADAAAAGHAGAHGRRSRRATRGRAGRAVGARPVGVAGADPEPVGGAGRQSRDGCGSSRAGVAGVAPRRRRRLAVADVVARHRGAAVARRRPRQADAAGAGGAGRDRRRARRLVRLRGRRAVRTGAVGVAGADLELVGGAGRQPGDGRGSSRAGVAGVAPRRRGRLAVADVVARHRGAAVARRGPRQADAAAARHAGRDRWRPRRLVRFRGGGVRVGAGAGRVRGPHLEGVGGTGGQPRHRGRRRRARVRVRGPRRRATLVAHVVAGDRRARARRCAPRQRYAGAARHPRRRRGGLAGNLGLHRRGPGRDARGVRVRTGPVRVAGADADVVAAARRQPRKGGGSRGGAGGDHGGSGAGASVAHVVAGDRSAPVRWRRPAGPRAGGAERFHRRPGGLARRFVRRPEALRPGARAGAVAGAHAEDVGRAGREAGYGRGGARALEGVVGPCGVRAPPVAHVVVGDRAGRGHRPRPGERQAGGAGGAGQQRRRRGRRLQPQDQLGGSGERAVAGGVAGADAHLEGHAGLHGRRPDGDRGADARRALLRPGAGRRGAVAHRVVGDRRAGVRRGLPGDQHRRPARRQRQRRRRRRARRLVRGAAAGGRVRALAGGVAGAHLHFVGDAGGEARDGGAGAGALEGVGGPVRGGALAVAQVVVRDRAAGVRRRRPGDVQGAAAGGGHGGRGGASGRLARSRHRRQRERRGEEPPSSHGASLPRVGHSPIGNAIASAWTTIFRESGQAWRLAGLRAGSRLALAYSRRASAHPAIQQAATGTAMPTRGGRPKTLLMGANRSSRYL